MHLDVAGTTRTALLRRGSGAGDDAPLVFAWHGFGSSAESMLGALRAEAHFDGARVIAAQGLGRTIDKFGPTERPGWQTHAGEYGDRDLALFDALVERLEGCASPEATYSTGFSNGGFFSHLLGCARPAALAAIAPVGGGFRGESGPCEAAMPTLIVHGTLDEVVPVSMAWEAAAVWHEANACEKRESPAGAHCVASACAEAPLRVCHFEGGHTWPEWASAEIAAFFAE